MSLFSEAGLSRKQIIMTLILIAGAFISVLNQTIISPAIPGIMSDLAVDVSVAQWLITIFTLVMAVMIPVTAYLLDRFSLKKLFIFAMTLFTIGSLLLAWGPAFHILIIGRIFQAISSGMLSPMIMSIIMWIFPIGFRGRAMGFYTLIIAIAPAIGPVYSGIVVDLFSWHFVFLSIAPLAVIVSVVSFFTIDEFKERREVSLDKLSLILSSAGLSSLLYGCSIIGAAGGMSADSIVAILAGIVILIWFGLRQLKLPKPMLELRVLNSRKFSSAVLIIMIFQASILVLSVILPIYIQTIQGYSATMTGLVFLPGAFCMGIMSILSGRLFDSHGPRKPVLIGAGALMSASFCLALLDAKSPLILIFIIYSVNSAGVALLNTPLSTWALNSLDEKLIHHGSAVLNTLRQASGAIGTAVLVTVMSIVMSGYSDPESITANMAGFNATAQCIAVLMTLLFIFVFFLIRDDKKKRIL